MISRVCVFGATGFVGRHLLQQLLSETTCPLVLLTRGQEQSFPVSKRVVWVRGDLLQKDSITELLAPKDVVVNLAYLREEGKPINLLVAKNIAEACRERQVSHLIHLSTAVVVGATKSKVIDENTPCVAKTQYESTKLAIEDFFLKAQNGAYRLSILRPTAILGQGGLNLIKLIQELRQDPMWLKMLRMSLFGRRTMNLVAVENVVAAILFLIHLQGINSFARYIISDDDDPLNNYEDIVHFITEELKLSSVPRLKLPFQEKWLSLLLKAKRLSNTNPQRIYSSRHLESLGFNKPKSLQSALLSMLHHQNQQGHNSNQ